MDRSKSHHTSQPSPAFLGPEAVEHIHILRQAIAGPVQSIELLPSCLQQIYLITMPNGSHKLLKCPPSPMTRLLRHERDSLAAEVGVLRLAASLAPLPPQLISRESGGIQISPPSMLVTIGQAIPYDRMEGSSSPGRMFTVHTSLWLWALSLSNIRGVSFGPIHLPATQRPAPSWREVFGNMLTQVFLDAEYMLVNVPYERIRNHFRRLAPCLDGVVQPKLVLLDAAKKTNILVDPNSAQIKGLVESWNALWGDPELAFCGTDSSYFDAAALRILPQTDDTNRDRRLLYAAYRSLLAVVESCYRQGEDARELENRRILTQTLHELDQREIDT